MNGKERIMTTLRMKEPDRVPVFPINHYFSATEGKMTIKEFSRSGEKMAAAVLAAYERFGWDGIQLGCDVAVEGEALGGIAGFPDYSPPYIEKFVLDDPEKLKNLKVPNPLKDGRLPVEVHATEIVVKEVGDEAFIQPYTACPMTCASQVRGVNELMMDIIDRPDFVEELLDFCLDVVFEYGKALVDAGAHSVLLGAALCSPNFASPTFYRKKMLPRHQKLIADLKEYGAGPVLLHICGDITSILPDMLETGADMFDIDWQNDMAEVKQTVAGKGTIRGNVDPSAVLLNGTPEDVYEKSVEVIKAAASGGGMILGSGCDVPYGTPYENMEMMLKAAEDSIPGR